MKTTLHRHALAFFALASLSAACGETLDPGSRVNTLRVIAQSMDAPYAAPGETVHITSLTVDPQGRDIHWAWAACLNPNESTVDGCVARLREDTANAQTPPVLAEGPGLDSIDITVPEDALTSLPDAARSAASIGVLSIACPGTLTLDEGAAGLPFRCAETGTGRVLGLDEFVVGVKRIVIRERDRNQNPVIARVTFDGAEWPEDQIMQVAPCSETGNDFAACSKNLQHKLAAQPSAESFETGVTEFGEGFNEQVVVQYFATDGNFENDTRIGSNPETKWAPRQQATGQDVTFWFVIRDNRGGVTWTTRRVHVQ